MLHDTDGCGMMTVQCHSVQPDEIKPDKWTQIFHLFLDLSGISGPNTTMAWCL